MDENYPDRLPAPPECHDLWTDYGTDNDCHRRGYLFEQFVATLFPSSRFEILDWRSDKQTPDGRFARSSANPDLHLRLQCRSSSHELAVECKYRSSIYDVDHEWLREDQLDRYRLYAGSRSIPVFIVVGVGGEPADPEMVCILTPDEAGSCLSDMSLIKVYRRADPRRQFFFDPASGRLK